MKLFLCDPQKNTACTNTNDCRLCNSEEFCKYTSHEEFAKLDKNGKPIKIKAIWNKKKAIGLF